MIELAENLHELVERGIRPVTADEVWARVEKGSDNRARPSKAVLLGAVTLILLGFVAGLIVLNTNNRQPADASVLASEFKVFNRPMTPSDIIPPTWPIARAFLPTQGRPTATRLLASNPGYGVQDVYAASYPSKVCLLLQAVHGGETATCDQISSVEANHLNVGTISGTFIKSYVFGLVANDVTKVQINGATAPVLKNNFFLSPITNPNPPLRLTIHLSDGPPMSKMFPGIGRTNANH